MVLKVKHNLAGYHFQCQPFTTFNSVIMDMLYILGPNKSSFKVLVDRLLAFH